ncbi:hypothetical protein Scep_025766 [Stephania cephalantha]|uniref:Uncharacterized protein n=1 Tax=Stephania cephalantha TaxID=152367 RepID=A0AAP0EM45_9MAGN
MRALAVESVKGNLRLSGYYACGQDGGVQLPREYVEDGVSNADLVLLVTTRPTTGNTLAWAVVCERDQWGRVIADAQLDETSKGKDDELEESFT